MTQTPSDRVRTPLRRADAVLEHEAGDEDRTRPAHAAAGGARMRGPIERRRAALEAGGPG